MWSSLLTEPMAVLGPYAGTAPSLDSFAPHSWRSDFNQVSVAGQFLELPLRPPEKWSYSGTNRAYAVFQFLGVRMLECTGAPTPGEQDDSMHHVPVGTSGRCELQESSEIWFNNPDNGVRIAWRRFSLVKPEFTLRLEAQNVMLYLGRQAARQYGWPSEA
jgi:hypothetical protein